MKEIIPSKIRELSRDIEKELGRMQVLENSLIRVEEEKDTHPEMVEVIYESLALKLHNFYTGCERIFQLIASELNGGKPSGYDWHRRLLDRMTFAREEMPPVLQEATAKNLQEYLGFRHVVRNIYGFELELERIDRLLAKYPQVWHEVEGDLRNFVEWLKKLADDMEN